MNQQDDTDGCANRSYSRGSLRDRSEHHCGEMNNSMTPTNVWRDGLTKATTAATDG